MKLKKGVTIELVTLADPAGREGQCGDASAGLLMEEPTLIPPRPVNALPSVEELVKSARGGRSSSIRRSRSRPLATRCGRRWANPLRVRRGGPRGCACATRP